MKTNSDYLFVLIKQCDEINDIIKSKIKPSSPSVHYGEICKRLTKDFLPPIEREDIAAISYSLLEIGRRCSEFISGNNTLNDNLNYQIKLLPMLTKNVIEKKKTCEDELRRFVNVNFKCGNEFEEHKNQSGILLNNSLRDFILAIQTAFFKNL